MVFECLKSCGLCCGPVPIPKDVYERNKQKAQPHVMTDIGNSVLALKTGTPICAFLDDEKKCAIYDERPEVCRKFGCSEEAKYNTSLLCPFLRTDGTPRKRKERRLLIRINDKKTDKMLERLKKEVEGF